MENVLKEKYECSFCNKKFNKIGGLNIHISSSHTELISPGDYYLRYINPTSESLCKFCNSHAKFKGFTRGFHIICEKEDCFKKSIAPFSKEYKMKVDGLSEQEYEEWSRIDKETKRKNTLGGFSKKRLEDPDFDKKNSRYCKEYWIKRGHSEEESLELSKNETKKNREKLKKILEDDPKYMTGKSWVSKEYWIKKGHSEEEAIKIVSEKQSTFSLEKCVEKYGEIEGKKIWIDRQYRWNKSYKKTNFSKKSQKLFWEILEKTPDLIEKNPKFATFLDGKKDESGLNHEETISTKNISIKPDFIIGNKIIEFDGVYWHDFKRRNKPENRKKEEIKDSELISNGYSIMRVSELDYDKDKEKVINECIKFLSDD